MKFSLNFKKNPITTVVGLLLIVVGLFPYIFPGRVSLDEAGQLQGLVTNLGAGVESVVEIVAGIIAIFAKDVAAKA